MSRARDFADLAGSADAGGLTGRNLVINGAALIYQRNSSTTANLGVAADRIVQEATGGTSTLSRETLTSGSPYDEGFRFYNRITNTATASGSTNYRQIRYAFESQEIASSGWNYKSSSSFVTWSFWIRTSVAGKYTFTLQTSDGTAYLYTFSKTLSADTWTKVTETIPGNSNLQFDNDAFGGLFLHFRTWLGSAYTNLSSENAWATYNSANISTSGIANFAGTEGATYDVTGIQLEVGSQATPFEHRSFADELNKCQRYYYQSGGDGTNSFAYKGYNLANQFEMFTQSHPVAMRAAPTLTKVGTFSVSAINQPSAVEATTINFVFQAEMGSSTAPYSFHSNSSGGFTLDAEL
tara:strand:+ start:207 stop:1262 length:1056 start_codon:yes stop_codon:yes gene_type:complete